MSVIKLHDLKPAPGTKHRKKRVGRGNASATSGNMLKESYRRNKASSFGARNPS